MEYDFQKTKALVLSYYDAVEDATAASIGNVVKNFYAGDIEWFGVHPFEKQNSADMVIELFWRPLFLSWAHMQRRQDIFIAGYNEIDGTEWTISMGHFMGIVQRPWLHIPANNRIAFLRYADFNCVKDGKITRAAFFCDIIHVMRQMGVNPLPMQYGNSFLYPGPRTHDGLLFDRQDPIEGKKTLTLLAIMIEDLSTLNTSGNDHCPPELLEKTWHKNMIWYGPDGIGASYTIPFYQKEHQHPFRQNLRDKVFNGHICRLSEGNYAGFFGWPNLTHVPTGGFLGMPESSKPVDMRVVDIYRREGDKLAENWVIIDLLHWLKQQGLDILGRCKEMTHPISSPTSSPQEDI